ncbi:MAG: hypothetical protein ABI823_10650 [Bryobacteraceae bacterium]
MKPTPNERAANRLRIAVAALSMSTFLAGCAGKAAAPPPPIKAVATLEEVMHNMIIPNAEIVWKAVGTISTLEGVKEIRPQTTDEWFNIESSATTLTEAGNLLMMDGRAKDQGHWMDRAKALREAGDQVRQAAKKHDADALFERGGYLFDACQGCHFEYRFEKDPKTIRTH